MKKLKIAQISPYYFPSIGGVSGVAQYLAEELVKSGHQVDVITARRDHKGRPELKAPKFEILNGVNVYRYKSILNIGHMSFFPGLITHLLKNNYDVIHFHSYRHPLCFVSALIGKLKGSVKILHGHGPFFEEGEISNKKQKFYDIYDKFEKLTTLKWSDKIIALNNYEKNRYIKIGVDNAKIAVVPNAAGNDCFEYIDNKDFIYKYNLKNKRILLFVAILNSFKRPDLLIQALPKIISKVPEAHLLLVGPDGGMLQRVEERAKSLKVESYYTFIGPLFGVEKQKAYSSADIFVLPSDWDAYPLVLMEALAHGLPCIATDCRGPVDIIENGKTGFIVKKGDVESIAEKIIELLSNNELYEQMSSNARRTAAEKYKADSITKQIENIYYSIIDHKK